MRCRRSAHRSVLWPIAGAEVALTLRDDVVQLFRSQPHRAHAAGFYPYSSHWRGRQRATFVAVIPEGHLVLIFVQDCTKRRGVRRGFGCWHITGRECSGVPTAGCDVHAQPCPSASLLGHGHVPQVSRELKSLCVPSVLCTYIMASPWIGRALPRCRCCRPSFN